MIKNNWQDKDALRMQEAAGNDPQARELALRVYTSRLIGRDPDLVMHGGGNTSVKLRARDVMGQEIDVLHVKGSGWDLETIEAAGLPAVRLDALRALRALDSLTDEEMVNVQRANLLDSTAPNPSVETLLHAWLPPRYIDHTHATAFLALANLPEVAAATAEIFGDRMALVPYIMPGFALAKAAARVFEENPQAEGLLLVNHGHFTWADTAKASYDRLIAHTNAVEAWLADRRPGPLHPSASLPKEERQRVLPLLRAAISAEQGDDAPMPVLDLRANDTVAQFLARPDLEALAQRGVATPDHVIRTKGHPLLLRASQMTPEGLSQALADYSARYRAYFERQAPRFGGAKTMLAPVPGLVWAEGIGLIGIGATKAAARIAADIGEQTLRIMRDGEAAGGFHPIPEKDLFDMEYWSLEQAKLGKARPAPLQGRVVLVTGAAGAIGSAVARSFARQGASLMLVDRDADALAALEKALGRDHDSYACDITVAGAAQDAVAACIDRFGGLDILVSNAGAALTGEMATLPDATLRQSFELNFFAPVAFAQAVAAVLCAQGRGGQLLFNVSKQAVNPGKGFGAYGLPKAATLFLVRQLALELGSDAVRVNGVNADRIRSGLLTDDMIRERAAARGLSTQDYLAGNLLRREVEAEHVADAFVALALAERTTGHIMTVDGGNVEAALR